MNLIFIKRGKLYDFGLLSVVYSINPPLIVIAHERLATEINDIHRAAVKDKTTLGVLNLKYGVMFYFQIHHIKFEILFPAHTASICGGGSCRGIVKP